MTSDSQSVYQAFRQSVDRYGDHPFLRIVSDTAKRYGTEPCVITYNEARVEIESLVARYRQAHFGLGHRVALLLENRPEMFFHWLAFNALGVSVVPLNPDWRQAELAYVLGHAEVSLVVTLPHRLDDLCAVVDDNEIPAQVICADLSGLTSKPDAQALGEIGSKTECALLYTSGTTGRPKGCILSNEYFLWNGQWYAELGGFCELDPGHDTLVTPLPMYHMNAMASSTMGMLMSGSCIVPLDRFHPSTWWDSVKEADATIIHYLGVMPAILLSQQPSASDKNHKVRFGFGAGVGISHHVPSEERFGFPLVEGWAMTETGVGAAVMACHEPRFPGQACFGVPPDYVDLRIVDEQGNDVDPGTQGELLVRRKGSDPAFGFFSGYLKNQAATEEAWAHGYFHTGDVVRQGDSGHLFFVDRKKNVIRRSGENIAAVEVEAVLLRHPDIVNVGVTAVPDEVRGDEVMACVMTKTPPTNEEQLAKDIVGFCLQQLAYYKAPGYVGFCDSLPLTATEKLQRQGLKDLALEQLQLSNCIDTRFMKRKGSTGA